MKTVLVIFGGRSPEHDVSIVSALASVIKPLELSNKYRVEAVYIDKQGAWHWGDALKDIALFRTGAIEDFIKKSKSPQVQLDGGLSLIKSGSFGRAQKTKIDVVFPVMHGSYGEDGALMGLLEMAGVPYVGCGVPASAVAMDKVLTKQVVEADSVPTAKWVWISKESFTIDPSEAEKLTENLRYPLFVKPAHAGSSIGITKVTQPSELINAVEVAAHYDTKILIEEAVENLIEVTLPIIGNESPTPALLERPLAHEGEFFDFDAKYMNGGKKGKAGAKTAAKKGAHGYSQLPAKLPSGLYEKAERLGLDVYRLLGCTGIARIDMLIDSKTEQVYFNEVNPMPGSLYAHNWRRAGVSGVELVDRLINFAEEAYNQKQAVQTSFSTNYLKQF